MPQQKTSTTNILQKLNPMPMIRQLQAPLAELSQLTMPSIGAYWDGIRIGNRSLRLSNVQRNLGKLFYGAVAGSLMVGKAMANMTSMYFQANGIQYRMDLDISDYPELNTIKTQLEDGACGANTNLTEHAQDYTEVIGWPTSPFSSDFMAELLVNSNQVESSSFFACIYDLMQPVLYDMEEGTINEVVNILLIILGTLGGVLTVGVAACLICYCCATVHEKRAKNRTDDTTVESIKPLLGNTSTNTTTYGAIDTPVSDRKNNANSTNITQLNIVPADDIDLKPNSKKKIIEEIEMPLVFPAVLSGVKDVQRITENNVQITIEPSKDTSNTVTARLT